MQTLHLIVEALKRWERAYVSPTLQWLEHHSGAITATFTVILAISTTLLWIVTKGLRKDTRDAIRAANASAEAAARANELARDNFTATHRPWISVQIAVGSDLTYDANGDGRLAIRFQLKNTGASPAANTDVEAAFFLSSEKLSDPVAAQKKLADGVRSRSTNPGAFGHTLFPGDTMNLEINLPIPRKDIEESTKLFPEGNKWFSPVLIGCVDYKFAFAGGHHQTGFIVHLTKQDPQRPGQNTFRREDGVIPPGNLRLSYGFTGVPAD